MREAPFRLFTFAACAAALVPRVAHRGMFVDGVTYASIARNLALGRGTFWSPSYTLTLYPQFHEHPPLGFWLQSWWFRLFGDHLFVERAYSIAVALATAALIAMIWRGMRDDSPDAALRDDESGRRQDEAHAHRRGDSRTAPTGELEWLPILLWIAVPVVSWSVVGNLLETTVAFFTTAALAAAVASALHPRQHVAWCWGVLSGVCIVGAALTKGPVGLFPLVAPVVLMLFPGVRRRWSPLAAQWIAAAVCALVIGSLPSARASLITYMNQQVVAALAGEREVSSGSFTILKAIVQGVWLPMTGVGVVAVLAARRFVAPSRVDRGRALCFFAIGLAGTLPILASAKQAGHYVVPAIPAFAIAASLLLGPSAAACVRLVSAGVSRVVVRGLAVTLLVGAAAGAFVPALGRDRERLADIAAIEDRIPRDAVVGICSSANADWGLHAWFERLFRVSLDAGETTPHEWFLKTTTAGCRAPSCVPASEPGRTIVLMRCRRAD